MVVVLTLMPMSWAASAVLRGGLHRDAEPRKAKKQLQKRHHDEAKHDDPDELRRNREAADVDAALI